MNDILYIIIPAYNESENIERVVKQWYPIVQKNAAQGKSRLVVIDDGSKDCTYQMLIQLQKKYTQLMPIKKENEGHGATLYYGYMYAIEHGADYIFQTDSDGQTSPIEFETFWERRKEFDMIIGHRNKREDGISRIFVTRVLRLILALMFGVKIVDANTPYRLMNTKTLDECLSYVPYQYFLTNVALSVIFHKKNKKVLYIPITFICRQGGKNSINLRKIFKIGLCAVGDFYKLRKELN